MDQSYLVFIETPSQVEMLKDWFGRNPRNVLSTLIISLHLEIDMALDAEGLSYQPIGKLIRHDLVKNIHEESIRLARDWGPALFKDAFYEKVAYPYFVDMFGHLKACSLMTAEILGRYRDKIILLFPACHDSYLKRGRATLTEGVFDGVLRYYIKKYSVRKQHICPRHFLEIFKDKVRILTIVFEYFKKCIFSRKPDKLIFYDGCCVDILFCDWGFDFERHLSFQGICNSDDFNGFKTGHLVWEKKYPAAPRRSIYPVVFELPGVFRYVFSFVVYVFLKRIFAFYCKKRERKNLGQPDIFLNQQIHYHFFRIFLIVYLHVFVCSRYIREILNRLKPSLVIISDADEIFQRVMALLAKKEAITVVSTNHGLYNHSIMRDYYLADWFAVWGEGIKKYFVQAGIEPQRISVVGNPSYEVSSPEDRQEFNAEKEMLILTSAVSWFWSYRACFEPVYVELLTEICRVLCSKRKYNLVIKSHPWFDFYPFYDKLSGQFKGQLRHIRSEPLKDVLPLCKLVIVPGIVTTAVLECLEMGIPMIYFGGLLPHEQEFVPDAGNIGVRVDSMSALEIVIDRIHQDHIYRENIVQKGNQYLKTYVGEGEKDPGKFNQFILKILETTGSARVLRKDRR